MPHRFVQSVMNVVVDVVIQHVQHDLDRFFGGEEAARADGFQTNSRVVVVDAFVDQLQSVRHLFSHVAQNSSRSSSAAVVVRVQCRVQQVYVDRVV